MRTLTGIVLFAACAAAAEVPIIPRPVNVVAGQGVFLIRANTALIADSQSAQAGRLLAPRLSLRPSTAARGRDNSIRIAVDPKLRVPSDEGYVLEVTAKRVEIRGKSPAGAYYGAQSLIQLVAPGDPSGGTKQIPCLRIEDHPRFPWRGMMLDPARHFIPKAAVLKFIDALAMHKMNSLQLHLTDDQGWRVEIRKYPRLTEIGSMRKETRLGHERDRKGFDGKPHGGFYSQADIREIVEYARERFVNVVPEIEMPGHAQAAIAAYPELGNTGEKLEVWTQWGVNKNVFNVNESTIVFLQNVLDEVLAMFPSKFIHVGGDEVPLDQWKASPAAQARMKELGLKSEIQLHGYFIRRMDRFLAGRGRRLVGWDEILEGGVDPSAIVMSWRGNKGGIAAAREGHDVVMAPNTHTYFDYYQAKGPGEPLAIGGFVPLDKVYGFDPVPPELSAEEGKRILGTQGQLWSEYMPAPSHVEYMAFPRATALAEAAWTPPARKDYQDFLRRLAVHEPRLKALGVNFRPQRQ
jgi:hexosaminidase